MRRPADFNYTFLTLKERDNETGLDYFLARYYSSTQGRFTSPDPGPYIQHDPQTWGRYSYARNNPLKNIDPTGKYFVVAPDQQNAYKQYLSTLLRSADGRALIERIEKDPRPTFITSGNLPRVALGNNRFNVTPGETHIIPGGAIGVSGTKVVLDPSNVSFVARSTGRTEFNVGLTAAAHEDFHVADINAAKTLQQAAAAAAAGDAPSSPGAGNTTGGTAEARALGIISPLGNEGNAFVPNEQTDREAADIIKNGNEQFRQDVQEQMNNVRDLTLKKNRSH